MRQANEGDVIGLGECIMRSLRVRMFAAVSVCFVAGLAIILWQQSRKYLTLAAGDSSGRSYILAARSRQLYSGTIPESASTQLRE